MWNLSKNSFLLSLGRSVFLKSECKSTNYFPNTQEFRRKSLEINSYLTVQWRFRRISTSLSFYIIRVRRTQRVCGRTGEGKHDVFNKQSLTFWLSETCRRLTTHIYAVYSCSNCRKTRFQLQNHIAPTGKIFFPNWEIIFSQLSTACWRINIQKLSCHCFPDIIAAFFWLYCEIMKLPIKQNPQGKDLPRLLRPNSVVH